MIKKLLFLLCSSYIISFGQPYPDQFFSYEKEELISRVESLNGTEVSSDGKSIILSDDFLEGSVLFEEEFSFNAFDRGLPSWNGHVSNDNSSFRVLIRFYKDNSWSPWLTAGYWKKYIWSSYGNVTFSDGEIDYRDDVIDPKGVIVLGRKDLIEDLEAIEHSLTTAKDAA